MQYTPHAWVPPDSENLWPTPDFDPNQNQIGNLVANSLDGSRKLCQFVNDRLIFNYFTEVNNIDTSIDAGREPNPVAPPVPKEYLPVKDSNGVYTYAESPYPVCAPLPLDPQPGSFYPSIPGMTHVGNEDLPTNPDWFSVGMGDATPPGKIVEATSDDGVHGLFRKISNPFGGIFYLMERMEKVKLDKPKSKK